ncbi:MAG: T9SS type A sorting domain-containing protein [Bacteroidia bacterium]
MTVHLPFLSFKRLNPKRLVLAFAFAVFGIGDTHAQTPFTVEVIGPDTVCLPLGAPVQFHAVRTDTFAPFWGFWSVTGAQSVGGGFATRTFSISDTAPGIATIYFMAIDSMNTANRVYDTLTVVFQVCAPPALPIYHHGNVCVGNSNYYYSNNGQTRDSSLVAVWDMGDGSTYQRQYGSGVSHAYSQAGTYQISLCMINTMLQDTICSTDSVTVQAQCTDSLSGRLFADNNNNGRFDSGDTPLAGYPVTIDPGGTIVFSDSNGYYSLALPYGTYTVTAPSIPGYVLNSPAPGIYTFQLYGFGSYNQGDFGYISLSPSLDLAVELAVSPPPRPGFTHCVNAYFSNISNVQTSGTVTIQYDSKATFQSAYPSANSSHNATNRTVTWTFSNLAPGSLRERVFACFSLPPNTPLGAIITSYAEITPITGDVNPANNRDTLLRTVVGSYDPNDKSVDQPLVIQGNEWLGYTIRFQNTGTDTAFNVVVRDTLDPNLDLSTFEMLGASHPVELSINSNKEAVWTFSNIMLPDSGANMELSQGHILYRVKAFYPLVPGTTIENAASIYFDSNSPIITNTTVNSIAFPLFFGENEGEEKELDIPGLQVFPNPASEEVSIIFQNDDQLQHHIRLTGADGKVLLQRTTSGSSVIFELKQLPVGMYFLHISNTEGMHTFKKLIKK